MSRRRYNLKGYRLLAGLLAVIALTGSCEKEEPVPAYLYVMPFQFTTDAATQGTGSASITEVWVTVDGVFLGAYALPAEIPVLSQGSTDVRLEAGIKENGLADTPDIYLFYRPVELSVDLQPGQTDTIRPTTSYLPETRFGFVEDFEDGRPRIFTQLLQGDTGLVRTQEEVFEGQYSGKIVLTEDNPTVELASGATFSELLARNPYVFIEVNYKADSPVVFGIVGRQGIELVRVYDPGFAPRDEWNKIYFNISRVIFDSRLDSYNIALQAFLSESDGPAEIYVDNIKLVYF